MNCKYYFDPGYAGKYWIVLRMISEGRYWCVCRFCGTEQAVHGCKVATQREHRCLPVEIGQVYGELTVVAYSKYTNGRYIVQCSCGITQLVSRKQLLAGQRDCTVCVAERAHTPRVVQPHKLYAHLVHLVRLAYWRSATKGTPIYQPWCGSIRLFAEYISTLPGCDDAELQLDRIDNTKGYEPSNLRLVTRARNAANRSSSYTLRGIK